MSNGTEPHDTVELLIAMHGAPAVLQALANVLAGQGSVCSGILSEVSSIEMWLQSQRGGEGVRTHHACGIRFKPSTTAPHRASVAGRANRRANPRRLRCCQRGGWRPAADRP